MPPDTWLHQKSEVYLTRIVMFHFMYAYMVLSELGPSAGNSR